jgi:hypothetical protein
MGLVQLSSSEPFEEIASRYGIVVSSQNVDCALGNIIKKNKTAMCATIGIIVSANLSCYICAYHF